MVVAPSAVAPSPPHRGVGDRVLDRLRGTSPYRARFAATPSDLAAAQALRFEVFNLELHEGLEASFATGRDEDPFDAACDHLLVEHVPTGRVVGTYRLQTGAMAARNLGYYSAQEFEFAPFEPLRGAIVELGRACVDRAHRNLRVLSLLWREIAAYAVRHGCRYFVGCSSMPGSNPRDGAAAYLDLGSRYLVDAPLRTHPLARFHCALDEVAPDAPAVPPLIRAYLSLGARICGAPALDRGFGTIDFLTWLDLDTLPATTRRVLGLPA